MTPSPLIAKMRDRQATPEELARVAAIMRRLNHHHAAAELEAEAERLACPVCGGQGRVDGHPCWRCAEQPTVWLCTHAHEVMNLCRKHGRVRVQPLGGQPFRITPSSEPGYFLFEGTEAGYEFSHVHSHRLMNLLLDEARPFTVRKA